MPTFPSYQSQRNINANVAAPLRNEAVQKQEGAINIVNTLADITQKWSDANDVMQYTQFKSNTGIAIAQQKAAAKQDPNQYNSEEHMKSLQKIKEKNLKGFSNKMVEQKAAMELNHDLFVAGIEIEGMFKEKQLLTTELKLNDLVNTYSLDKANAKTVASGKDIDNKMMSMIQANVASGVITQARGRKLLDDYRLGAVDLDIMSDNATEKEQSYVYDQLKAGKDGIYSDLTDSERAERLEKTELHIRRNKIMNDHAVTQNQNETEKDLLLSYGTETVTEGQVQNMLVSTGIRKSFGEDYIKAMYDPPAENTSHSSYNKIKMAQLDGKKQKDINNLVIQNIKNLTLEDKDALVKSTYDTLDTKTITIKASAEALNNWALKSLRGAKESDANEVMFNFFKRLDKEPNSNIDQVMQSVEKDYIRKYYPDTTSLPDVPNLVGNRNKILSVYKKESKAGGMKAKVQASSYQNMEIGFDDL